MVYNRLKLARSISFQILKCMLYNTFPNNLNNHQSLEDATTTRRVFWTAHSGLNALITAVYWLHTLHGVRRVRKREQRNGLACLKDVPEWPVQKDEQFRCAYPVSNTVLPEQKADVLKALHPVSRSWFEVCVRFLKSGSVETFLTQVLILRPTGCEEPQIICCLFMTILTLRRWCRMKPEGHIRGPLRCEIWDTQKHVRMFNFVNTWLHFNTWAANIDCIVNIWVCLEPAFFRSVLHSTRVSLRRKYCRVGVQHEPFPRGQLLNAIRFKQISSLYCRH